MMCSFCQTKVRSEWKVTTVDNVTLAICATCLYNVVQMMNSNRDMTEYVLECVEHFCCEEHCSQ